MNVVDGWNSVIFNISPWAAETKNFNKKNLEGSEAIRI